MTAALRAVVGLGFVPFGLAAAAWMGGVRVNTTASIPLGLYRLDDASVERGAYVVFCPPSNELFALAKQRGYLGPGFCDGGQGLLMKRAAGIEGDLVAVDEAGVRINGADLACSAPRDSDPSGRPLPRLRGVWRLGPGQIWPMSDGNPASFDGRYFGPVGGHHLQVIKSVFTWGGKNASVHC